MPVSAGTSFLIILAVALTTFATRVLPFLIFPKGKEIPEVVRYLGRVLTPAVIGMLVIYCLKGTTLSELPYGIPEGLAVLVTAGLHILSLIHIFNPWYSFLRGSVLNSILQRRTLSAIMM